MPALHDDFCHEAVFCLWLANQLCDLVQTLTFATGSVARLHMRGAGAASRA